MTDFNKILEKAKEIESKFKESQKKIKNITAEGTSGGGSVKVVFNGNSCHGRLNILQVEQNQVF